MKDHPPTCVNGNLCIEMPTTDIARSSDFHKRVFVAARGFDDTTGEWTIPPISAKSGN